MFNLSNLLASLVGIAMAISIHEFGHAYSAHLLGDDTAKYNGRMTLNPAKHIDPLGLIILFICHFGWAKPVPVNPNNFKNYKVHWREHPDRDDAWAEEQLRNMSEQQFAVEFESVCSMTLLNIREKNDCKEITIGELYDLL